MGKGEEKAGYGFGTFQGVFTPSILTIIGVVMYLRFGWMLGNVGLTTSLIIVTVASSITFLTGLSISALATNMHMKGGGAYFMLSRSFGAEAGAAMGIPLALSQAIGVSFYTAGFAEALTQAGLPVVSAWDPRLVGLVTLVVLATVSTISANIALKSQYFIMAAIAFSLVAFFLGGAPTGLVPPSPEKVPAALGFWPVFAVFFPAVTGILSGVGMSGDLKDPGKSIPRGTIAAVLTGYLVYMAVPVALNAFVPDASVLRTDSMILQKCARWPFAILLGVWAATLSSAVGSFLCAPRVFQALSRDRLLPRFLGRGYGDSDDPRVASFVCFVIAGVGLWLGDINIIAPILTMFNLSTYALLNLSAALEEMMGNPSWRPTFRVRAWLSFAGFAGCTGAMFMISPGWTFAALGCEAAIYWSVKRRALRARWGDMRTGLQVALMRFCIQRLTRHAVDVHNWRPNVLAFTSLPVMDQSWVLKLAREISGNRGLVTVAAVVPSALADQPDRLNEYRGILARSAEKARLGAVVRVQPSADTWSGVQELVRTYGFGPLVPNTILMGAPVDDQAQAAFSGFVFDLASLRRNLVVIREPESVEPQAAETPRRSIDVWWRGTNPNGAFMLAVACLVRRGKWEGARLRLCRIAAADSVAESTRVLEDFIQQSRIEAEALVVADDGRPFIDRIAEVSAETDATCIGLRTPRPDETPEAYWGYFKSLRDATATLPLVSFSLASEDVDFRRIFRD